MDRPLEFRLNYGHPLAQGLVFAGIGRFANSTHYRDSSPYGNHGTLTNMAVPATATSGWTWNNYLGRWTVKFESGNDLIQMPLTASIQVASNFSISAWRYKVTSNSAYLINRFTVGAVDFLFGNEYGPLSFQISSTWKSADTTVPVNSWSHIAITKFASVAGTFYLRGIADGTTGTLTANPGTSATVGLYFGNRYAADSSTVGNLADVLVHNRVLSPSEIAALADPSNTMLSGLILPPRRRLWGAVTAAPPAGVKWWTLQSRSRVVGGGVS